MFYIHYKLLIETLIFYSLGINNKIDCDSPEVLTPEGVLDSLRKHRWMFSADEQVSNFTLVDKFVIFISNYYN